MKLEVYNRENKKVDTLEAPDAIFNAPWRPNLVHQVVVGVESNERKPWAHVKERGAVRGGGKKPWRQKGTGRARAGSNRSPLWRGGGITFGPSNERNYEKKINKKMRREAFFSVLSKKLAEGDVRIIDSFGITVPKTKAVVGFLKSVAPKSVKNTKLAETVLLVPAAGNKNAMIGGRNIAGESVVFPKALGVFETIRTKLIFIEKPAVEELIAHYSE